MELASQFDGFMEGAPELQLMNATDLLRSGQHDKTLTLKALQFLRFKAMHNEDREAKMKLSILYADGLERDVCQDQGEATMWARSVYDKQLSSALAACACFLLDGTIINSEDNGGIDPFSTLELIFAGGNGVGVGGGESKQQAAAPLLYLAGLLWIRGIGEQDTQRGLAYLMDAATQGKHKYAAYELGRVYSDRYLHSLKDMRQSLYWYARALELGDDRALCDLAYGYYQGDDDDGEHDGSSNDGKENNIVDDDNNTTTTNNKVPKALKNDTLAFQYARQGADAKDRYCQYILGHLCLKGRGTAANAQEAIKWLELSAHQGFTEAMEELATVYLRGVGNVGKDYAKAHSICLLGMENNVVFCQAALGDIYRQGWGVERDYHKAFQFYQTAASHGDPYPYAQHMLGEMFLNGEGVPQDLAVAKEWYVMASNQCYEPSRHKLQTLQRTMQSIQDSQNGSFQSGSSFDSYPSSPVAVSPTTTEKKQNRWSLGFFTKKK